MTSTTISATDFAQVCQNFNNVDLIDVRTPAEFREAHLKAARNVPLGRLDPAAVMQAKTNGREQALYVICQSGGRGRQACELFHAAGFANVVNVEGGTAACITAGLPVIRGPKSISLERQVRIAAGSLVLLGLLFAWLIHAAFILLSAFVGAGLVFAGITDSCGMGMILARMPWNQCSQSETSSCST